MAQMVCRNEGKVLPSDLPNAMSSSQYYWTGYHIRRSNWIQIIGEFQFAANIDVLHIEFRKYIKLLLGKIQMYMSLQMYHFRSIL